ncbi:MAG: hypothetical protein ACEPOW_03405 [Bacteroidales bacterium]
MKRKTNYALLAMALCILLFGGCKKNELKDITSTNNRLKQEGIKIDELKEMLTLSAITMRYHEGAREKETKDLLAQKDLATKGNWDLIWYADNNMLSAQIMIVKHHYLPNTYAIVPKGQKQNNVFSLYQGFNVLGHKEFTWVPPGQKPLYFASGAHQIADAMFNLKADSPNFNLHDAKVSDMIKAMINNWDKNSPITIYVAGHSLGGANASMLGVYIHTALSSIPNIPDKKVNLRIFNYAGPNLFEQDFADYYNNLRNDQHINVFEQAVVIRGDVVSNYFPQAFDQMVEEQNYNSVMKVTVKGMVGAFNLALKASGEKFIPLGFESDGSRMYLINKQDPKKFELDGKISTPKEWINTYLYNHLPNNYLATVGAPEVPHLEHNEPWQN